MRVINHPAVEPRQLNDGELKRLFGLGKRGHAAPLHDTSMAPDSAAMTTAVGTGTERVV